MRKCFQGIQDFYASIGYLVPEEEETLVAI